MSEILTLGIETSCDETSASVVRNGREVLSNEISSQIELHKEYGGVVPEIASRKHIELIIQVIDKALRTAGVRSDQVDLIGVTNGPGLIGALLVGLSAAKGLAFALQKPLIGVHHIEGHISANFIQHPDLKPPFLCLVVSGGHSHIIQCEDYGVFRILGRTRDDAAGEAFDKISRAIGLGYPGGPAIDRAAKDGNPEAFRFPRVRLSGSLDFSFSGLKTAVLNELNRKKSKEEPIPVADIAASFQKAAVDILVENTIRAYEADPCGKIALAGGVAANSLLRASLKAAAEAAGASFYCPAPVLCTDNGAMIACAAYYAWQKGRTADLSLNAYANRSIEDLNG
mgnify:CR=1 FL=1